MTAQYDSVGAVSAVVSCTEEVDAVNQVIRLHTRKLFSKCPDLRIEMDYEDVMQLAILRLSSLLHKFDPARGSIVAFASVIMKNLSRELRRRMSYRSYRVERLRQLYQEGAIKDAVTTDDEPLNRRIAVKRKLNTREQAILDILLDNDPEFRAYLATNPEVVKYRSTLQPAISAFLGVPGGAYTHLKKSFRSKVVLD